MTGKEAIQGERKRSKRGKIERTVEVGKREDKRGQCDYSGEVG